MTDRNEEVGKAKRKVVKLSGKPAPVNERDPDMDDGPLTASGKISKRKKGGAPPANAATVEAMMREATAAKEAGLAKAKAEKEALKAQRTAQQSDETQDSCVHTQRESEHASP